MPLGTGRRSIAMTLTLWAALLGFAFAIDSPVAHLIDRYEPIGRGKKAPGINFIKKFGDFRFVAMAMIPLLLFHRSHWRAALTFLVACAISGVLYGSKWVFGRHRPSFRLEPFTFYPFKDGLWGIGYAQQLAMPSGHACLSFAAASCLGFFAPRWRWAFFAVAIILGIERVLEGAHYPSDIILGAGFGILSARFAMRLASGWFGVDWHVRPATTLTPEETP